jgi:hypothetical protein
MRVKREKRKETERVLVFKSRMTVSSGCILMPGPDIQNKKSESKQ